MVELLQSLWHNLMPTMDESAFVAGAIVKLTVAGVLGAAIGLERQFNKSPAGLRTNMFLCMGSALCTILSYRFSSNIEDHTRITGQIITGIGFIGAGSILHERGGVTGLTTAATIFVVAAVGMAVGGGEYLVAAFATILILGGLYLLGRMETRFNLKAVVVQFQVMGLDTDKTMASVNEVLEQAHVTMDSVHLTQVGGHCRVQFVVTAVLRVQHALLTALRKSPAIEKTEFFSSEGLDI